MICLVKALLVVGCSGMPVDVESADMTLFAVLSGW